MAHLGALADLVPIHIDNTDGLHYTDNGCFLYNNSLPVMQVGWSVSGVIRDVGENLVRRACILVDETTLQQVSVSYSSPITGAYLCPTPSPSPVMRIVQDADTGNEFNHIVHARITPV